MLSGRAAIGQVIEVDGSLVVVRLRDDTRSQVVVHHEGLSGFEHPEDIIGVGNAGVVLVGRVLKLSYADPFKTDRRNTEEPVRHLQILIIGSIVRTEGSKVGFRPNASQLPALGAAVFPLSAAEKRSILSATDIGATPLKLGYEANNPSIPIEVDLEFFLGAARCDPRRHRPRQEKFHR